MKDRLDTFQLYGTICPWAGAAPLPEKTMAEVTAERLVSAYIKIRDKRAELKKQYDLADAELLEKQNTCQNALLEILKGAGGDSIKTQFGTATRTVKTRYWTTDWQSMYDFIKTEDAPYLLEQRIHQGNIKKFLEEHPDREPMNLNLDSSYAITVRRAQGS